MAPSVEAAAKGRRPWFWPLALLIVVASLVFPVWLRAFVVKQLVTNAVWTLGEIGRALPQGSEELGDDVLAPLFPFWPGDVEVGPVASPPGHVQQSEVLVVSKPETKKHLPYRPVVGPEPTSSRASRALVLSWVNSRIVPTGVTRESYGEIPPGIELRGVGALGVGLIDGDRLIKVGGAPVTSRGLVVGEVLAARSRLEPSLQATLVRMTKDGPKTFSVFVEQPYLEQNTALDSEEASAAPLTAFDAANDTRPAH